MGTVLVTGANGFIGSHLVERLLARGFRVRCLVRPNSSLEWLPEADVEILGGDVTRPETLAGAVRGCETVYHLAGLTRALTYRDFETTNASGTGNVAQACAAQRTPPVLVCVSSLAAAGPSREGKPRVESDRSCPVSLYGRSKLAGEHAARRFARYVPTSIVRPGIVLGERDRTGCELFRPIAQIGIHVVAGYRASRFSLIHARDLAEALIQVAARGTRLGPREHDESAAGIYFAAADEQPTMWQLGRMLAGALGVRRVLILPLPEVAAWGIGGLVEAIGQATRRPLVLGLDKIREATAGHWTCSAARLRDELGFAPAEPLAQRLLQTAEWYRNAGWLALLPQRAAAAADKQAAGEAAEKAILPLPPGARMARGRFSALARAE